MGFPINKFTGSGFFKTLCGTTMGFSFLMYITPVVYSVPEEGFMRTVMIINPFTPVIATSRDILSGTPPEFLAYYLILMLVSIPLFFIALISYRISIPIIVERSA